MDTHKYGKLMKDIINWSALSEYFTSNRDIIRSNRIPKKHKEGIKELKDLLEYWKKRNPGK